jgi:hypothetical protein
MIAYCPGHTWEQVRLYDLGRTVLHPSPSGESTERSPDHLICVQHLAELVIKET